MALNDLSICAARAGLDRGDFTALELTEACLGAMEAAGALNAYTHIAADSAREMARAADARKGEGGALNGIPLGIKDLFCVENMPTQAASKILDGFRPPYESTITGQLRDAGAVFLGKLNMDEFAMGSSNETSHFGSVTSPWRAKGSDAALTPGGSSGGSAAAVSAGLCLGATGTDTGGSIRQPAAFTGIVGIKPTYGRCSRWGVIAFASSLDQAGPMTRTVADAALMLREMSGHDPKDSTSAPIEVPDFAALANQDIAGKTVGIPREYRMDGMPQEIEALWQKGREMLADAGAKIVDISLPHTKYALPVYYVIAPAEASSNLARYDGVRYGHRAALKAGEGITEMYERTRAEGFGDEVQRRVMIGAYVLSAGFYDAYYVRAMKVRTLIRQDFERVYADGVDFILTPATPSAAFALGAMQDADPIEMYLNDIFTVTVNLAGLPGVSVPTGLDANGLPLGLQLIGQPWQEGPLLAAARALEERAGFTARPDRWW